LNKIQYRDILSTMKSMARPLVLLGIAVLAPASARAGEPSAPAESAEANPLRDVSAESLVAKAREALRAMGDYRARLVKTERIKGEVRPPQTIEVLVCRAPHAVRMEYVAGPKSGRRVIWRQDHRPTEILVREGGILGLTSLWLDSSGGLARGDTNHAVSEIGFGNVLDVMDRDLTKGKSYGGHARKDLGRDASGLYRIEWTAPAAASGLYARRVRVGIDMNLRIPVDIEVFDGQGFLERYEYKNVRAHQVCKAADIEEL
jgi:hypothetical protein